MPADPHLRRRPLLARRLAAGLPPWAVARGSNLPEDDLAALLFDAGFRELVDCCAGILAMSREARLARMERIAGEIIDDALTRRDPTAAMFVLRQRQKKRDPIATLARGFCNTLERERARAERLNVEIEAGRLAPETPPPAPEPAPTDPMAEALAAEAMRPDRHPDPIDAALWRKASALRQKMLDEQVLHHAVEAQRQRELRQLPAEPHAVQQVADLPLAPDAILSRDELQTLAEVRAMYRLLPEDRLRRICATPPKGMEKIFAVLAFENGIGGWPGGP